MSLPACGGDTECCPAVLPGDGAPSSSALLRDARPGAAKLGAGPSKCRLAALAGGTREGTWRGKVPGIPLLKLPADQEVVRLAAAEQALVRRTACGDPCPETDLRAVSCAITRRIPQGVSQAGNPPDDEPRQQGWARIGPISLALSKDLIAAGPGGGKGGNPPAVTRLAWVAMHS